MNVHQAHGISLLPVLQATSQDEQEQRQQQPERRQRPGGKHGDQGRRQLGPARRLQQLMQGRWPGPQPGRSERIDIRRPQQPPVEQAGVALCHLQQLLLAPIKLAEQGDAPRVGIVEPPHQVGLCAQQAAQLLPKRAALRLVERRLALLHQFARVLVGQAQLAPLLAQTQLAQARFANVAVARGGLAPVVLRARQAQAPIVQCLRQGAAQLGQIELRLGRPKQGLDLAQAALRLRDGGTGCVVGLQYPGQLAGQCRLLGGRFADQWIGVGGAFHQRLGIGQFLTCQRLPRPTQARRQGADVILQRRGPAFGRIALGLRQLAPYFHRAQLLFAQGDAGQQRTAPGGPGQCLRLGQRAAVGLRERLRAIECLQLAAGLCQFRLQCDRRLRERLHAPVERVVFAERCFQCCLCLGQRRGECGDVGAGRGGGRGRRALVARGGDPAGRRAQVADERRALGALRGSILQVALSCLQLGHYGRPIGLGQGLVGLGSGQALFDQGGIRRACVRRRLARRPDQAGNPACGHRQPQQQVP